MTDYELRVNFREGEEPLRVPLTGCTPTEAENAHQALEINLDHAREVNAPVVFSLATEEDPEAGEPIDPSRVTGVDLIEPSAAD